jgi:acetyl esterase/lipase
VLTLLSIFAHACQSATAQDDSKRSSPVFKSNVEYAKVGGKSLRLDAYLPAGKLPAPAIVLLHGGGFTSGVKGGYTGELARHLFTQGYAAFDIDYRLMGDPGLGATLPKAMLAAREDLARAVEHVLANSKSYGIDPDRLAVSGGSAGAITALLATYGEDRLTQRPGAVVSLEIRLSSRSMEQQTRRCPSRTLNRLQRPHEKQVSMLSCCGLRTGDTPCLLTSRLRDRQSSRASRNSLTRD